MTKAGDEFSNIPILLEPIAEQEMPPIRPLPGREAQQPLFDDLPQAARLPRTVARRVQAPPPLSKGASAGLPTATSTAALFTLPLPGTSSESD